MTPPMPTSGTPGSASATSATMPQRDRLDRRPAQTARPVAEEGPQSVTVEHHGAEGVDERQAVGARLDGSGAPPGARRSRSA